ncbi:hypothetical protein G6F65_021447 [Rhizopus arrhizus]|nr:hypothetical protein G6F65_021447 [Rhizopus arrhizus]
MTAGATQGGDAVIVCPQLPDLNATTLLGQIRTLRPETIRIALVDALHGNRPPPARLIGPGRAARGAGQPTPARCHRPHREAAVAAAPVPEPDPGAGARRRCRQR